MTGFINSAKVSAFVVSYNRQETIETCLHSLSFVDELILIDKSSSDQTRELAAPLVDQVHVVPWSPTVEETRLIGEEVCSNPWMIFLDDDECLNPAAIRFLIDELKNPRAEAYFIPRTEYILGQHHQDAYYWPEHHLRCYYRGALKFSSTVHKGIELRTTNFFIVPIETGVSIEHFSHDSVQTWIKKANRYTSQPHRERMLDSSVDLISFAHASIDKWLAKSRNVLPGSYVATVALLRATYDIIDRLKCWEEESCSDGRQMFRQRCKELQEEYARMQLSVERKSLKAAVLTGQAAPCNKLSGKSANLDICDSQKLRDRVAALKGLIKVIRVKHEEQLSCQARETQKQIDSVLSSRSWRVTRPLRAIEDFVRRLRGLERIKY